MKIHLHSAQKLALIFAITAALVFAHNAATAATPGMLPSANSGMIPNTNSGPVPNTNSGMIANPNTGAVPNTNSGMVTNPDTSPMPNTKSGMITNPNTGAITNTNPANPANANINMGKASWSVENKYWQSHFASQSYANGSSYSTYAPAYQYGVTAFNQYGGQPFSSLTPSQLSQLQTDWAQTHPNSPLSWIQAEDAVRAAYDRLYNNQNAGVAQPVANP